MKTLNNLLYICFAASLLGCGDAQSADDGSSRNSCTTPMVCEGGEWEYSFPMLTVEDEVRFVKYKTTRKEIILGSPESYRWESSTGDEPRFKCGEAALGLFGEAIADRILDCHVYFRIGAQTEFDGRAGYSITVTGNIYDAFDLVHQHIRHASMYCMDDAVGCFQLGGGDVCPRSRNSLDRVARFFYNGYAVLLRTVAEEGEQYGSIDLMFVPARCFK